MESTPAHVTVTLLRVVALALGLGGALAGYAMYSLPQPVDSWAALYGFYWTAYSVTGLAVLLLFVLLAPRSTIAGVVPALICVAWQGAGWLVLLWSDF